MTKSLDRRTLAAAAIALGAALFLAINIASDAFFRSARLDLTDNGLFTVSEGTKNILRGLEEPITLRFFYAKGTATNYPQIQAYAKRVRDLLAEYASLAGGNLIIEEMDPEPFSEAEDRAVALGIQAAPTQEGLTIYFGLAGTNTVDGKEVIPFFNQAREQYLEYDLTSLIARLNARKKPVLGLVTNLPLDTGPGGLLAAMQGRSQPYMIYEQLRENFDIDFLTQDFDRVPETVDALMIAHPRDLSQKTLYAIDQFVMRGGRVILFVDPISEISQSASPDTGMPVQGATFTSDLPLLKNWGVDYDPKIVVADRSRAQKVQVGRGGQVIDYVLWSGFKAEDMDRTDLVTSALTSLNLATVGTLRPAADATTIFTPLVQTTADSMEIPAEEVLASSQPETLLARFLPTGQRHVIAARISGPIKSAYPDGPPPKEVAPEGEEAPATEGAEAPEPAPLPAHIASVESANILVVADSDVFDDRFWVQVQEFGGQRYAIPSADNAALVLNAAENLLGSNDLISLRTRASSQRPFTVVDQLRRGAEERFLAEEKRLQGKLEDTQRRIDELQRSANPGEGAILTAEQETEIQKFRGELAETRGALRQVQLNLRKDIDALGNWLAFVNIALIPIAVAAAAIALAILRTRRREARLRGKAS